MTERIDELLALQRELIEMENQPSPPPRPDPAQEVEEDLQAWLEDMDPETLMQRAREQFGGWLEGLDHDLRDTKPSTILLLLGLGVLVGRLSK
ncbi:hypothetical protein BST95_01965 [Halioglobus japonicus]|uniref:Uncharacterized protein n=1 Tax=Halioglobus japonicus TaxID=930805 RepID=A0AAP8MC41_9GAMM|nr:hypothetical protein [Halioglobus japonicus]AQA17167.1 hypothetical protein BST95_01965 [Halioglobus japonicus]PLW85077.1 hypothetical protein C0029_16230 [Halioglobus japonicus]GHD19353.1 hypothetical protein GCM10007052_27710 [Halioglobus japonicus]